MRLSALKLKADILARSMKTHLISCNGKKKVRPARGKLNRHTLWPAQGE